MSSKKQTISRIWFDTFCTLIKRELELRLLIIIRLYLKKSERKICTIKKSLKYVINFLPLLYGKLRNLAKKEGTRKCIERPGIDPGTFHLLSERSII